MSQPASASSKSDAFGPPFAARTPFKKTSRFAAGARGGARGTAGDRCGPASLDLNS
jgi:hypothetical protein